MIVVLFSNTFSHVIAWSLLDILSKSVVVNKEFWIDLSCVSFDEFTVQFSRSADDSVIIFTVYFVFVQFCSAQSHAYYEHVEIC